jgi:hypothetical protein
MYKKRRGQRWEGKRIRDSETRGKIVREMIEIYLSDSFPLQVDFEGETRRRREKLGDLYERWLKYFYCILPQDGSAKQNSDEAAGVTITRVTKETLNPKP